MVFQLPCGRVDGPKSVFVCCQINVVKSAGVQVVVALVLNVCKGDTSGDDFLCQVIADDLTRPVTVEVECSGVYDVTSTDVSLLQLMNNGNLFVPVKMPFCIFN